MRIQPALHIVILILKFKAQHLISVLFIDLINCSLKYCLLLFKKFLIMIPDNVFRFGAFHIPAHIGKMKEPLSVFCVLRSFFLRQLCMQIHQKLQCIYKASVSFPRMNAAPMRGKRCRGRVKGLSGKTTQPSAINGIGVMCAEILYFKMIHASACFFFGSESYAYGTVLLLRMFHKILHGLHYLCYAGFIIGSQQGRTVSDDNTLPFHICHLGKVAYLRYYPQILIQYYISAIIILYDPWPDIPAAHGFGGINMRYKAYCRDSPFKAI